MRVAKLFKVRWSGILGEIKRVDAFPNRLEHKEGLFYFIKFHIISVIKKVLPHMIMLTTLNINSNYIFTSKKLKPLSGTVMH